MTVNPYIEIGADGLSARSHWLPDPHGDYPLELRLRALEKNRA
jgi:hypothetical protein